MRGRALVPRLTLGMTLAISVAQADCVAERFLFGDEALILADRTHVGARVIGSNGYVEAGVASQLHTSVTGAYIQLRNHATLNGTAYASGVGMQAGAQITGDTESQLPACAAPELPTITPGSEDVFGSGYVPLLPDSYGEVSIGVGATLVLSSGDYHFDSLVFQPDAKLVGIWTDGPVRVFVQSAVSIGDRHRQGLSRPRGLAANVSALQIYTAQSGQLYIGTDSDVVASIVAPNADVIVGSRTTVDAALYGRTVNVQPDVTFGDYVDVTLTTCGEGH